MWRSGRHRSTLDALRRVPGVTLHRGATRDQLDQTQRSLGISLPKAHNELLAKSNGLESCWGYRRILAVGEAIENIGPWNQADCWKFAWRQPLANFLCFADTGLGDQFAYRIDGLRRGDERVFMLDATLMEPDPSPVAESFAAFLAAEVEKAMSPSPRFTEAHRQVGPLARGEHAIPAPSPLLGATRQATQFAKVSSRLAMTMNGDMARQLLDPEHEGQGVLRIEQEFDVGGWPRLRVVWASPGQEV